MAADKILVIEDEPDMRLLLQEALGAAGYTVVFAMDGARATLVAQESKPDLILLDLGLPAGDGYTVLYRFQKIEGLARVPVIVVTGKNAAVHEDRAKVAGAAGFLTKPLALPELLQTISDVLERARANDEASSGKILVVEDDSDLRLGLMIRLSGEGFEAVGAPDASTAIPVALKEEPDLILLDLGLPGGDGHMLIQRFRNHPKLAEIPVIVHTARAPSENRDRALKAGAADYFQKPANDAELIASIRKILSESRKHP